MKTFVALVVTALLNVSALSSLSVRAAEAVTNAPSGAYAARGYQLLTTKAYLPPDFDQSTFDELWKCWEEPLRSQAAAATPEARRQLAFARYGLTSAPGDSSGRPQQYVVDEAGNWTMNCLTCHQGKVAGQVIAGVPNSQLALQTLVDDVRTTKFRLGKSLTRMDIGSGLIPLGTTNGTTNAIIFGVALMASRDAQLNVVKPHPTMMIHHDHDAPAWWNFKKKQRLYSDGFATKGPRPLMQFMLIPENGPAQFAEWESDFREIYAWLESLEPPRYPYEIDRQLALAGREVFVAHCADCHGTYGPGGEYPNKIVPIDEVGTDPVRLAALTTEHRAGYGASWFAHFGQDDTIVEPGGYMAPPLDGIWASAPYFHNGSVPTLWHVLHSDQRPAVWSRTTDGYDPRKVGLEMTAYPSMPGDVKTGRDRRKYFDTAKHGKSAAGHTFPDQLDEDQKRAVLEYLKTL
jgi:mono/diheme cytochrome c family protein